MKKYLLIIILCALLIAACNAGGQKDSTATEGGSNTESSAEPNTLTAIEVSEAALDASADFWSGAPKLDVPMLAAYEEYSDGPTVTIQAAYDADHLTIRAEWPDTTESVWKNSWTWDGSEFSKSDDEDRLMLTWPIGNNAEFATKGCTVACHNLADDPSEWWMGSDSEDVRYDAWQWKAARTNPAGYVDDKWWSVLEDAADIESSRHGDAKESGGYANNRNEDQTGPLYVSNTGLDAKFIMAGEEIDIDLDTLETGAVIPGYVLAPAIGSRGDVATIGQWADGKWTMVLQRALDTGNDDDTVFTPGKPLPFGLSVVDNGGGLEHAVAKEVLTLKWE